jgi:hypothetical protein
VLAMAQTQHDLQAEYYRYGHKPDDDPFARRSLYDDQGHGQDGGARDTADRTRNGISRDRQYLFGPYPLAFPVRHFHASTLSFCQCNFATTLDAFAVVVRRLHEPTELTLTDVACSVSVKRPSCAFQQIAQPTTTFDVRQKIKQEDA